jgi:hypothetical protein
MTIAAIAERALDNIATIDISKTIHTATRRQRPIQRCAGQVLLSGSLLVGTGAAGTVTARSKS